MLGDVLMPDANNDRRRGRPGTSSGKRWVRPSPLPTRFRLHRRDGAWESFVAAWELPSDDGFGQAVRVPGIT